MLQARSQMLIAVALTALHAWDSDSAGSTLTVQAASATSNLLMTAYVHTIILCFTLLHLLCSWVYRHASAKSLVLSIRTHSLQLFFPGKQPTYDLLILLYVAGLDLHCMLPC